MANLPMDSSRRRTLIALGVSTLGLFSARKWARADTPACILSPEQTEGPYFVDEDLNRTDIRSDPRSGKVESGLLLQLALQIQAVQAGRCQALAGAQVDIWHCNARGIYSNVRDPYADSTGQRFLRGYQVTNAQGLVNFTTIYPGWYPGRTPHIHVKVRTRNSEFTSQIYFDDAFSDLIYQQAPYNGRGRRGTGNRNDFLFQDGGKAMMLNLQANNHAYQGQLTIGVSV